MTSLGNSLSALTSRAWHGEVSKIMVCFFIFLHSVTSCLILQRPLRGFFAMMKVELVCPSNKFCCGLTAIRSGGP